MYFLLSKHVLVFISIRHLSNKWPLAAVYLNSVCTTSDIQRHESSNTPCKFMQGARAGGESSGRAEKPPRSQCGSQYDPFVMHVSIEAEAGSASSTSTSTSTSTRISKQAKQ